MKVKVTAQEETYGAMARSHVMCDEVLVSLEPLTQAQWLAKEPLVMPQSGFGDRIFFRDYDAAMVWYDDCKRTYVVRD